MESCAQGIPARVRRRLRQRDAMFPSLEQFILEPPVVEDGVDLPDMQPMGDAQHLLGPMARLLDFCLALLVASSSWTTKMASSFLASPPASAGLANADAAPCDASTFQSLTLPNIEVSSVDVLVNTTASPESSASVQLCQVTVHYTHPGQNDGVNTLIAMPLVAGDWNERFQMVGGGGWGTGYPNNMFAAAAEGYSSVATDGGHDNNAPTADWGLVSEGNVNWPLFWNFAVDALNEGASLGRQATELYYGTPPKYSYFNGCSTGGRQGHIMAQQHPEQFDGILAGAPAINWQRFIVQEYWGPLMANLLGKCFHCADLDVETNGCRQTPYLLRVCWTPSLKPRSRHVMD